MKFNYIRSALSVLFILILFSTSNAQDTLHLKNGEIYIAKVTLVGNDEVVYKLFNDQEGPSFELKKNKIMYISLSSGTVLNFSTKTIEYNSQKIEHVRAISAKKNAFKWEVLSLLTNDLCFGYERHISKNQSVEIKAAIIGIGNDQVEDFLESSGYFIKLGYKFIDARNPSAASMFGTYIKPEICYTEFKINNQNYRSKYFAINYGVQGLLMKNIVIEFYGGVGLAYNEMPEQMVYNNFYYSLERDYYYSNTSLSNTRGYASCFTGGMVLSMHF